tara:strand:- start:99 stop:338 length:240 start_codon:yes stop_codon:yes gene_type:complete
MKLKFDKCNHRPFWWKLCCGVAILLSITTFSPLVIGQYTLRIFNLPYLLAAGLIIGIAFILLTIAGTFFYPKSPKNGDK